MKGFISKKWLGILMMVGSWALILVSVQLLLQGKSVFGRLWIVGAVFGLFLLELSFLAWRQAKEEEKAAAQPPGSRRILQQPVRSNVQV
jgi:hypothetical protein